MMVIVTEGRRETARILNVILTGNKIREMIVNVLYYLAGRARYRYHLQTSIWIHSNSRRHKWLPCFSL